MLTPLRRRVAALAMVLLVPVLGGCGIAGIHGNDYQTDQVYQPAVGVNNRSGVVDVLGAVVVSGSDGSGTFIATLVNKDLENPATLTQVTGPSGMTIQVVKPVAVAADGLTNMAQMGAVGVSGEAVQAGGFARLTLTFDTGQSTMLNVPIVDRNQEFSGIAPAIPNSSATP